MSTIATPCFLPFKGPFGKPFAYELADPEGSHTSARVQVLAAPWSEGEYRRAVGPAVRKLMGNAEVVGKAVAFEREIDEQWQTADSSIWAVEYKHYLGLGHRDPATKTKGRRQNVRAQIERYAGQKAAARGVLLIAPGFREPEKLTASWSASVPIFLVAARLAISGGHLGFHLADGTEAVHEVGAGALAPVATAPMEVLRRAVEAHLATSLFARTRRVSHLGSQLVIKYLRHPGGARMRLEPGPEGWHAFLDRADRKDYRRVEAAPVIPHGESGDEVVIAARAIADALLDR